MGPHLNDYPIPCFWWEGCHVTPTVIVAEDERYCRKHAKMAADKNLRAFVMKRDRATCQRCGKGATDTAHLVGRGARYIKYEPANVVALCQEPCHRFLDTHPAAKRAWIEEKFGPERYSRLLALEARGERLGGHVDLAAVIRGLGEYDLTPEEMREWRSGAWLGR